MVKSGSDVQVSRGIKLEWQERTKHQSSAQTSGFAPSAPSLAAPIQCLSINFLSVPFTHITMLLEDLRNTREDLERLEQAIAERSLEDPKHVSFHLSHFSHPL
jgi:hypothetical protein